jgi:hypothetical protein
MDKEDVKLYIALLCILAIIFFLVGLSCKFSKDNCEKKGGVYINSRTCITKEQIDILNDKDN